MLYKPDGIAGRNDKIYPAVEGENTITDTITGVTGFTAVFALCGMPNGCIVDFTSISVVEESEETTTTSEPVTTLEIIDGTELLKDTEFGKVRLLIGMNMVEINTLIRAMES